jgi:hypothetical protein
MASSDDFDDGLDFDTQVEVTIDKKNNPHVIGLRLRNIRNFGLQITGIKRTEQSSRGTARIPAGKYASMIA